MWNKRAWTLSRRAKRTTPNQKTRRKRRRARSRPKRSIHRAPQMPSHLKSAWPSWRHWSGPRAARTCSPTRPTRSIWLARPIASSSSWRRCTTYSMSWSAPRMPRGSRGRRRRAGKRCVKSSVFSIFPKRKTQDFINWNLFICLSCTVIPCNRVRAAFFNVEVVKEKLYTQKTCNLSIDALCKGIKEGG